ncbi:MAG TPA: pitrilysin family protein, partial [Nevskiaceae bacterium]|nr:pitrilysin family protein [Nevskiaceae bacterium]
FNAKPTKAVKLPAWASRLETQPPVPAPTLHPTVETLPNGIKLIVQPEPISDTVAVYGDIRTRASLQEPKGQDGVASVLDQLFDYGGGKLDRTAYQRALDDIAAQESGGTGFGLVVSAQHFDRGVQLLAMNELQPRMPAHAFKVVQQQVAGSLAGLLQSPGYLFGRAIDKGLFPANDPSLRQATPKSVSALTLKDVKTYYDTVFRPDETTIVVIGNVDAATARKTIEKYFGEWHAAGPRPKLDLPAVPNNHAASHWVPDHSAVQDSVVLAQTMGITLSNPQHYALDLGNVLLGQGFYASRLYRDLRANAGLVYTVGSSLRLGETRSAYVINYGADPDKVAKARAIVLRDLQDMQKEPVSASHLNLAKALMLRQLPLGHASFSSIASAWIYYSQHHLPLDQDTVVAREVVKLSAKDVQDAFAKWLRPADLVEVVRGPKPH